MKRILSTILVVILCLSLCACSGVQQEVYDAAKAGYEEATAKYDVLKSKFEKYSTVIEALEKEDYDGAVEAVNAMRPAPEVTEVEITMDNLWDYFEITEDRQEQVDAQGEMYALTIDRKLALKEGVILADTNEYPTDVAVGYEYDEHQILFWNSCEIDFDTFTSKESLAQQYTTHRSEMKHFPKQSFLTASFANNGGSGGSANIIKSENFEILNASGTLYLVNK